jgi:glycine/D-amino acid oxidase-like deaminating enzyme
MTAVLLARAGKDVLVLEARTVGACATGNTTAKVSLLQGSHLSKILSKHGKNVARAYVDGNREGQEWVLNHCQSHSVAVQRPVRQRRRVRPRRTKGVPGGWPARRVG